MRENAVRKRQGYTLVQQLSALVASIALVFSAVSCTPRPDMGEEVLSKFLEALSAGDIETAVGFTDRTSDARRDLTAAWDGLQAEGLRAQSSSINGDGSQSTVEVDMTWSLPRNRQWQYTSVIRLSRTEDEWAVRWAPSVLHPQLGRNQHPELRAVEAPQASVLGSDGTTLLEPGIVHRVVLNRDETQDVQGTINRIATIVNNELPPEGGRPSLVDAKSLGKQAQGGSGAFSVIVLPSSVPPSVRNQLMELDAVTVNDETSMVRPDPAFAPDLMSRIESVVQEKTTGTNGWSVVAANSDGVKLDTLHQVDPEVQPAVKASISKKVQDAAQQAVDTRSDAEVMLVAVQPSTGDILAVAQTGEADKKGNLALTGQFPPGSTYKIVTAAAGMQNEELTPGSTVPCPGSMEIGPRIVTNYNGKGVGDTSLQDAFARSCNTTFGDIAYRMKPGEMKDISKHFGIGVDYQIAGLETITGSVSDGEDVAERIDAGYGQGFDLASPFGMAMVSATVAHGSTPTPKLVPSAGTLSSSSAQRLDPVLQENLKQMMRSVVTSGTATAIASRGEVYGKTGEAEVSGGSHAWFTGWRDDIAFATLVVHGGGSEHAVAITDTFLSNLDASESAEG
ncbi:MULTISPECIES: penicillin-binding transpeptidase domain-containing protein [unclassified Corynebacterium]|uniref:penicillin-binding transpeptidase domain-containing protein n=1 Tax=unclassified Corynebacterium TaxID=2624378 RepID=UPI00309CAEEC